MNERLLSQEVQRAGPPRTATQQSLKANRPTALEGIMENLQEVAEYSEAAMLDRETYIAMTEREG
jgi:hypothetical protein